MKKIKKVLAMIMAMAMVMGLGMTAMAANSATITIENAGANAKFNNVQVVVANQKTATGWDIVDDYANFFQTQFTGMDEQQILAAMIKAAKGEDTGIADYASKYAAVLDQICATITAPSADSGETSPITVNSAGVYVIRGFEAGYTYGTMSAYISFKDYDTTTGLPTALADAKVEAKRVPTTVEKNSDDTDKVTEIGNTLTYTVEGVVPYIAPTELSTAKYWVTDKITGADYKLEDGVLKVSVSTSGGFTEIYDVTPKQIEGKTGFSLDLTEILANNTYANDKITISYQAVVKDYEVGNEVLVGKGENEGSYGQDSDKSYTGDIVFTKYNEDGTITLEGAGFEVRRVKGLEESESLRFSKISDGVYKYDPNGSVTEVFTGEDGTVTLKGLDLGGYEFSEKTAPEGYYINSETRVAVIDLAAGKTKAEQKDDIVNGTASINDSKLASLPGTGGIGTTIFTIGGIVIMIAAAALFFANRRKNNA